MASAFIQALIIGALAGAIYQAISGAWTWRTFVAMAAMCAFVALAILSNLLGFLRI